MKTNPLVKSVDSSASKKIKKYTFLKDIIKNPFSYCLMLPGMLYVFLFSYMTYPFLVLAFQKYDRTKGILGSKFVGFKNFEFFFTSKAVLEVTWNTIKLNAMFITGIMLFAMVVALFINEIRGKLFIKITTSVMLFPRFLSWMVVAYIVYAFFNTSGIANSILGVLGIEAKTWYNDPSCWPGILTVMKVWKSFGMKSIILLAAITGFDSAIYESAAIDGANRWQKISKITIPMLMPTICILVLLDIGRIFRGDFGMIYAIIGDNGVLYSTTDVIDTYVFRGFRTFGRVEQSVAVGLYQSLMSFAMVYGMNAFTRKFFKEGALF